MRALLVAGSPCPSSSELVRELAAGCDLVVAIDRGAEACRRAGVAPDAFCGDADTVSPETLAWVKAGVPSGGMAEGLDVVPAGEGCDVPVVGRLGARLGVRLFPPAKYDTDLSLGFACARQLAAELGEPLEPVVCCASGGRMDHALAVFGVLAANADLAPVLVEDASECRILSQEGSPSWELGPDVVGRALSLVALSDGSCVSEQGLRWELDHFRVDALRDRGISNLVDAPGARVTCHEGVVAVFLMRA